MQNTKCRKLTEKILLGVLVLCIFAGSVRLTTNVVSATCEKIIFHSVQWKTPFESEVTKVYDYSNGITIKSTTATMTEIVSVKPSDERRFTTEQWNIILNGIKEGSIVWED